MSNSRNYRGTQESLRKRHMSIKSPTLLTTDAHQKTVNASFYMVHLSK